MQLTANPGVGVSMLRRSYSGPLAFPRRRRSRPAHRLRQPGDLMLARALPRSGYGRAPGHRSDNDSSVWCSLKVCC